MKGSRITAIGLVAGAALWIASGHLMPHDSAEGQAAIRPGEAKTQPLFRVEVTPARVVQHSPTLTLSGRTEADHKVAITVRTGGVLTELRVKRGQHVEKDEVHGAIAQAVVDVRAIGLEGELFGEMALGVGGMGGGHFTDVALAALRHGGLPCSWRWIESSAERAP